MLNVPHPHQFQVLFLLDDSPSYFYRKKIFNALIEEKANHNECITYE